MPVTSTAKEFLRERLDESQIKALRKFQAFRFRTIQGFLWHMLFGRKLDVLATIYNSDKWNDHWYARQYQRHFAHLRTKPISLLEIGIGGYDDPEMGGSSLRMWRTYFSRGHIHGIDIYDKRAHDERRIATHRGSQIDERFLDAVVQKSGKLDIIIDDGSHLNAHVLTTFRCLFPHLAPGGLYVVEDTQTSYWRGYGGSSDELNRTDTSMGFLKSLVDSINADQFETKEHKATEFDREIAAMHFYESIVFIEKRGKNRNPERRDMGEEVER